MKNVHKRLINILIIILCCLFQWPQSRIFWLFHNVYKFSLIVIKCLIYFLLQSNNMLKSFRLWNNQTIINDNFLWISIKIIQIIKNLLIISLITELCIFILVVHNESALIRVHGTVAFKFRFWCCV